MAWLNRLDAKWKARDARWEAWLDRRLSPIFDVALAWFPLVVFFIVGIALIQLLVG